MISYETKRLYARSKMVVKDGSLSEMNMNAMNTTNMNLLTIKPQEGDEAAFVYSIKETGEDVCHIGFTWQRGRFEISYGTNNGFRNKGYMCEALTSLIVWLSNNTKYTEVWGLPNGAESEHILKKTGFKCYGMVDDSSKSKWYRYSFGQ